MRQSEQNVFECKDKNERTRLYNLAQDIANRWGGCDGNTNDTTDDNDSEQEEGKNTGVSWDTWIDRMNERTNCKR